MKRNILIKKYKKMLIILGCIIILIILSIIGCFIIIKNKKINENVIKHNEINDKKETQIYNTSIEESTINLGESNNIVDINVTPENTSKPEETQAPKETTKPSESTKPSTSTSPSTSPSSKPSTSPTTSTKPKETTKPSESTKPSTTPSPSTTPKEEKEEPKHEPFSESKRVRNTKMEQTIINAINEQIATVDIDAMNKEYDWNETRGKAVANIKAKTEGNHYFTFRSAKQIKAMINAGGLGAWATDTYYVYC